MGEARTRMRQRDAIFAAQPHCIFCGGTTPASTIEHLPPRALFRGKQRPQGLEFPSCQRCNNGTSDADLVASFMARINRSGSSGEQEQDAKEFGQLMRTINKRIPGLLEDMKMGRGGQKIAGKGLLPEQRDGLVKADGPRLTRHMQMFSVKLGQALHFECTGRVVPAEGGIYTRWYSNVDQLKGVLPQEFLAMMPGGQTLRQGLFRVDDQFEYTSWCSDDGSIGSHFAAFGFSFAVLAMVTMDRQQVEQPGLADGPYHFAPGEILSLPPT